MTKSSFCTAVFRAYYGQPERYRQAETPSARVVFKQFGAEPQMHVMLPDGRTLQYHFGDELHLRSVNDAFEKNMRRSRGPNPERQLLSDLTTMHDTGLVSHVIDSATGHKILSNRQKKEWRREMAKPETPAPDRESGPMEESEWTAKNPEYSTYSTESPSQQNATDQRWCEIPGYGRRWGRVHFDTLDLGGDKPASIDRGISPLVASLHNAGYKPMFSCSGLPSDHPDDLSLGRHINTKAHIIFPKANLNERQQSDIWNAANRAGFVPFHSQLNAGPMLIVDSPELPHERAASWQASPEKHEQVTRGRWQKFHNALLGNTLRSVGAQPMNKYAVKKPRSIFDTLPDLSDPARYAAKAKTGRDSASLPGQTMMFEKPPADKPPTVVKVDRLPDMPQIGSESVGPVSVPPSTAQRSLVAGGESIALPPTKAPETITKTIKARPLSDERRVKGLQDDLGNWFRIHNQDIHGLPPDSAVKLVKYLAHEGRLFRLSHVDHPEHGSFIHLEHGVESDVPHQGRGTRIEMRAVPPETLQAMKYVPKDHPLVELAADMMNELKDEKTGRPLGMYGPKDVTKTTKTGVQRLIGAGIDPDLARKRASYLGTTKAHIRKQKQLLTKQYEDALRDLHNANPDLQLAEPLQGRSPEETAEMVKQRIDSPVGQRFLKARRRLAEFLRGEAQIGPPRATPPTPEPRNRSRQIDRSIRQLQNRIAQTEPKAMSPREKRQAAKIADDIARIKRRETQANLQTERIGGHSLSADEPALPPSANIDRIIDGMMRNDKELKALRQRFANLESSGDQTRAALIQNEIERLNTEQGRLQKQRDAIAYSRPLRKAPSAHGKAGEQARRAKDIARGARFSAARSFADAVIEKYTQVCQEHDMLQRFAAAYYGEVERYGGMQSIPHVDSHAIDDGYSIKPMTKQYKLQNTVVAGPPRGMKGAPNAGQFKKNPLSSGKFTPVALPGANKYAARVKGIRSLKKPDIVKPVPGQTSMFEAPLSAELPAPAHDVPFGVTSPGQALPAGKDWHIKALDEIGLAPAPVKGKTASSTSPAASPLEAMFKPPTKISKETDANLVALSRRGQRLRRLQEHLKKLGDSPEAAPIRDEIKQLSAERSLHRDAETELFARAQKGANSLKRHIPGHLHQEVDNMLNALEDARGNPDMGVFQRAISDEINKKTGKLSGYDPSRLGHKGKVASFETFVRNMLQQYLLSRPKRKQARESMVSGGQGHGEYVGDEEQQPREIADPNVSQSRGEWLEAEPQQRERKEPELLVYPGSTKRDELGRLETISLKRGEGDRPLATDEEILRAANPQGRAQKAAVLNLEAKLVNDHLKKLSPEAQWLMQSHLSGMSPEYIAGVISIPKGTDLEKEADNNAALQHVMQTPSLHSALNDDFRSRLLGMLQFKRQYGKEYPLHDSVAGHIRSIIDRLKQIPVAQEIREKRSAGDAETKFAGEFIRVYFGEPGSSPAPTAMPTQSASQPAPTTQWPPKIPAKRAAKGKRGVKSTTGQTAMQFQLESKNSLGDTLVKQGNRAVSLPPLPKKLPSHPVVLARKLASHVFETEDPEEWKQLADYANKHGMFIKIQVQPAERVDKSESHGPTRVFMIPKRYACHFEDTPEKYGLMIDVSPHKTYGGVARPSGQKEPSSGLGTLGTVVSGLVGGRRGGAQLARAFSTPQQTKQPAKPKAPPPPRALTAAEADQLGNEISQRAISEENARNLVHKTPGGMWWIDYSDPSSKTSEGKKAAVKPPKAEKAAAQVKSPDDAAREEHKRLKLENDILYQKQRKAKLEAIERGEVPQGRGRRSKQEEKAEQPPKPIGATLENATIKLENRPPNPIVTSKILRGADTIVHVGDQTLPAYYAWAELDDVVGSHEIKNGRYVYNPRRSDPSEQPRDYSEGTDDNKKIGLYGDQIERHGSAPYYVSPIPKAQDGPMTVDDQNLEVSNGNGRRLIAERLRERGKYHIIANEVTQAANDKRFSGGNVTPDDVKRLKHPILIRVVPNLPAGSEGFKKLASHGNESISFSLPPTRAAAQLGNTVLDEEITSQIVNAMQDEESDDTVGDLLTGDHPVSEMIKERIPASERSKYLNPDGTFNSQAKPLLQDMVLSRFIDIDSLERGNLAPSLTNAIGSSAGQLLQVGPPAKEPLQAAFKFIIDNRKNIKTYQQYREQRGSHLLPELETLTKAGGELSELTEPLLEEFYKAKSKSGQFSARAIREVLTDLAKASVERTTYDPLWRPVETVRPMLMARAKDPSIHFSPYEQRQFQKAMKELRIENPQDFLKLPVKEQIDLMQSKRQKAAKMATPYGAEDESWVNLFLRVREDRRKKKERQAQLLAGVPSTSSQPRSSQTVESPAVPTTSATAAPQPKPAQKGLGFEYTQRRHHDATRDLYTAVHAAYYRKTTFPPQRVARKNSAPKRSKVH